jgi:hypothetical protein
MPPRGRRSHHPGARTGAGKVYGCPFGVDVAFGDFILGEPEVMVGEDALKIAGIAPTALRVYGGVRIGGPLAHSTA